MALMGLAKYTGTIPEFLETPSQADEIYTRILTDIDRRYVIGYYPTNRLRDGLRRKISIEVRNHPEYTVWGQKSYFAKEEKMRDKPSGDRSCEIFFISIFVSFVASAQAQTARFWQSQCGYAPTYSDEGLTNTTGAPRPRAGVRISNLCPIRCFPDAIMDQFG
jgi:hypothetical protein